MLRKISSRLNFLGHMTLQCIQFITAKAFVRITMHLLAKQYSLSYSAETDVFSNNLSSVMI